MRTRMLIGLLLSTCVYADGMGAYRTTSGAKTEVTLNVVDDAGHPVMGAVVNGYFWSPMARECVGSVFETETDERGRAAAKGRAFSFIEGAARCDRHYRTTYRLDYPGQQTYPKPARWPEWVTTNIVVLKRIRNPVPMYVKKIEGPFPARDVFMGYDMMAGDWVPPYGRGREVDMEVRYSLTVISTNRLGVPRESDSTLAYRFPRDGDGILQSFQDRASGSAYTTLYEAPTDGYVRELAYRRRYIIGRPLETNSDPNHCHYIRIRTAKDKNGNVIKAMYGKIVGSMLAQPVYYLNPDGTRNIEFDPDRNLFGANKREVGAFKP